MGKKRESGKRSVDTLCALLSAACSLKERLTYKGALAFAHPYRSRRDNSRALHTRGAVRSDQRCLAVRGAGLPNDAYLANSASHQITHTHKKTHVRRTPRWNAPRPYTVARRYAVSSILRENGRAPVCHAKVQQGTSQFSFSSRRD